MDLYFIVGELSFPPGGADRWRGTINAALRAAEGPTQLSVKGELVSLRAFLVDDAYFAAKAAIEAALAAAGAAGARGTWYSGDHVSGRYAMLPGGPQAKKLLALGNEVRRWTQEAAELDAPPPRTGQLAVSPSTVVAASAKKAPAKKATPKKPAAKKASPKKPAAKKPATKKATPKKLAAKPPKKKSR